MTSTEAAEQDQHDPAEGEAAAGDAAAVRAGADVEVPATEPTTAAHTTRTLSDTDPDSGADSNTADSDTADAAETFPLTTDEQAQDDDSIVNPGSS